MSKIITKRHHLTFSMTHDPTDCSDCGIGYRNGDSRGYSTHSGNGIIYADGHGNGYVRNRQRRENSAIDPVSLCPLVFYKDSTYISWDDVWDEATEDEKLILIQLMCLKRN